jgi:DNA polymerase I-like protein with 3'-5' exonuclease and polymerase domains
MPNTSANIQADLEWKDQLPAIFSFSPVNNQLREEFRRMYHHLKSQGVSVTSSSDNSDPTLMQWLLERNDEKGRLLLYRRGNEWEMHGFKFVDEQGNSILEFENIRCPTKTLSRSERIEAMKAYNKAHKEDKKQRPTARKAYHDLEMSCLSITCLNVASESLTELLYSPSISVEKHEELKMLAVKIEKEANKLSKSLALINKLLAAE